MEPRTFRDLVDELPVGVKRDADDPRVVGAEAGEDLAVCGIVAGREHLLDIGGGADLALQRPAVDGAQRPGIRRQHDDGLDAQRVVDIAGRITIGFADELRFLTDDTAGQERGDVQLLPGLKIIAQDDGEFGFEHAAKLR